MRVLAAVRDTAASSGAPVTVTELAQTLAAHPNGVRRHLDALAAAGLVDAATAEVAQPAAARRGRPSVRYDVTLSGRSLLAGAAAPLSADYLAMTAAFAGHLAATSSDALADAHAIGRAWGADLARRIDVRAPRPDVPESRQPAAASGSGDVVRRKLLRLLDALGFSPAERADGTVALRTCPLLEAAQDNPDVLCQVHLGLVQGASRAYGGPGEGGDLRPFAEPGACTMRLP